MTVEEFVGDTLAASGISAVHLPYTRKIMNEKSSPLESQFATVEEADAYDRWFRAKVQASLDDQRPTRSHKQVMAALRKTMAAKRGDNASDPMGN